MSISISNRGWAIIGLTVATAVIHFIHGGTLFYLNGLGYLGLLGVLYLPFPFLTPFRSIGRWALIGYTILTIILYFVFNDVDHWFSTLGLVDKAIEVVLVALLFMDTR